MGTIIAYIVIICLLVRALLRSGRKGRGRKGESKVSSRLRALRKKGKYNVLDDILIKNASGGTSQIDHVVVSEAGVFVIETKNYRGTISGESREQEWRQRLHRKTSTFENPILQNKGHIAALKTLLDSRFPELKYHSLVVFPSRNLLSVEDARVVSRKELAGAILSHKVKMVSADDVEEITDLISGANITSRKERRAHIRNAKKNHRIWKRKGWR